MLLDAVRTPATPPVTNDARQAGANAPIRPARPLQRACPVCGGPDSTPLLAADDQPPLVHALAKTAHAARRAPTAALRFAGCVSCGLVRNRAFRPDLAEYGPGYLNTQRASATYLRHERHVARIVAELARPRTGAILEIGSGDGTVIRYLHEMTGRVCIGFDPAGPAFDAPRVDAPAGTARMALVPRAFDAASLEEARLEQPVAAVCARHVLEHVPDPVALLRAAHGALQDDTPLLVEVPDLAWIARRGAFYDFFHEHCCLFDASSIRFTLAQAGFRVERLTRSFGGQYLVVVARRVPQADPAPNPADAVGAPDSPGREARAASRVTRFERLADRISAGRNALVETLAAQTTPTVIWGAGAKGVSLLNQIDSAHVRCAGAIDEHVDKQRRFVPGSGHPIWAPAKLCRASQRTILVMNPNYADEVEARLRDLDVTATTLVVTTARAPASAGSTRNATAAGAMCDSSSTPSGT